MTTSPRNSESYGEDLRPRVSVKRPPFCVSSHVSMSLRSNRMRAPMESARTWGDTRRSNVRSPTRQYLAASCLVSRGESTADVPCVSCSRALACGRYESYVSSIHSPIGSPREKLRAENAWKASPPPSDKKCQTRLSLPVTYGRTRSQTRPNMEALSRKRQRALRKRQETTGCVDDAPKNVSRGLNASNRDNLNHGDHRARCGIVRHRRCLQSPHAALNAFGLFAAR